MSLAISKVPTPVNEPVKSYAPGSPERASLTATLEDMASRTVEMPLVIGGQDVRTGNTGKAVMPHRHAHVLGVAIVGSDGDGLLLGVERVAELAGEDLHHDRLGHRPSVDLDVAAERVDHVLPGHPRHRAVNGVLRHAIAPVLDQRLPVGHRTGEVDGAGFVEHRRHCRRPSRPWYCAALAEGGPNKDLELTMFTHVPLDSCTVGPGVNEFSCKAGAVVHW